MNKMVVSLHTKSDTNSGKAIANSSSMATDKSLLNSHNIQAKLTIGQPDDKYEQEADSVADKVMTMPEPALIQQSCSTCQERKIQRMPQYLRITSLIQRQSSLVQRTSEDKGESVKTKIDNQTTTPSVENSINLSKGLGNPLHGGTRTFMENRFGADFSSVRIHNNNNATELNKKLNSQAFTMGSNIFFNQGKYSPDSTPGKHLLAHELTHVIQQKACTPSIQRRLRVNPNHPSYIAPPTDPAASLTPNQRYSMMNSLIHSLCDLYEVDPFSGEVQTNPPQSMDPSYFYSRSDRTGCCCLSILSNPLGSDWFIDVSQVVGPRTIPGANRVILSPTTTPVEFGSYTATGDLAFQGQVPAAGHELCGHAALMEIGAHPGGQDRTRTDVHDPTVRIENMISNEQGVPASDMRGLAISGVHRGESVDRITITNYPFNGKDVPSGELGKLQFAADYIRQNDGYVDILGHSDSVGSVSGKQTVSDERAIRVKSRLISMGVQSMVMGPSAVLVPRFTRVEGVSDSQPPPPPLNANQDNWRRVEIFTASYPAGAQNPPTGTPATVTPHIQNPLVPVLKSSSDPCIRHLVGGAYP